MRLPGRSDDANSLARPIACWANPLVPGPTTVQNAGRMAETMRLAWLFDIDGTLLTTGGAAREAFALAVRDVLGREDPLRDIDFAGRIEPLILADILAKHGVEPRDGVAERFWDAVIEHMGRVLRPGRGRLMAGVPELLDVIGHEPRWVPTLLTGNMTRMARVKLRHYGIERRFAMGAYGEEAASRDDLARLAVGRIGERHGVPPRRCIVVGDTIHDVGCARAAGARAVAVATGFTPRAALEAREPDLLLDDLRDPAPLLEWAREIEGR
jgi:phosphoglycolate phosphatase